MNGEFGKWTPTLNYFMETTEGYEMVNIYIYFKWNLRKGKGHFGDGGSNGSFIPDSLSLLTGEGFSLD